MRIVIDFAQLLGWRVAHFRPGINRRGQWQTAVAADGEGFPDLVMVHEINHRLIFVELKSDRGQLAPEQYCWLDNLRMTGNEVYLWSPDDWSEIEMTL